MQSVTSRCADATVLPIYSLCQYGIEVYEMPRGNDDVPITRVTGEPRLWIEYGIFVGDIRPPRGAPAVSAHSFFQLGPTGDDLVERSTACWLIHPVGLVNDLVDRG
jgi:hypothetical protein